METLKGICVMQTLLLQVMCTCGLVVKMLKSTTTDKVWFLIYSRHPLKIQICAISINYKHVHYIILHYIINIDCTFWVSHTQVTSWPSISPKDMQVGPQWSNYIVMDRLLPLLQKPWMADGECNDDEWHILTTWIQTMSKIEYVSRAGLSGSFVIAVHTIC